MKYIYQSLSTSQVKKYDIKGYGIYVKYAPIGFEGYIVTNDDPNSVKMINIAKLYKFNSQFHTLKIINKTTHTNEQLQLVILETLEEFNNLPEELQDIRITDDSSGLATESTLNSINSKVATENTLSSINSKIIVANTDKIQQSYEYFIRQDKGYFFMLNNDTPKDIIIENPNGSNVTVWLVNWMFQNSNTNDITIEIYKNSSYTGTGTQITLNNKNIGLNTTPPFTTTDITGLSITPGTLIGSLLLPGNVQFKLDYTSFGLIKIPESNNIHFKITANGTYNSIFDFIVE